MAWRSLTPDEIKKSEAFVASLFGNTALAFEPNHEDLELFAKIMRWLQIRHQWNPAGPWLPSVADIYKSALLERMMSGYEPLSYPPPVGYSCPWYAAVEDAGPHFLGPDTDIEHPNKIKNWRSSNADMAVYFKFQWGEPSKSGERLLLVMQHFYYVVEEIDSEHYIIRDASYETPYRFRLYYDPHIPP